MKFLFKYESVRQKLMERYLSRFGLLKELLCNNKFYSNNLLYLKFILLIIKNFRDESNGRKINFKD